MRQIVGEKFQGNPSFQAYVFRLVNHSHAASAEFPDDAVVRDGSADRGVVGFSLIVVLLLPGKGLCGRLYRWSLQEASCLLLRRQQRTDLALQRLVGRACVPQKGVALLGRVLQHRLQQTIDCFQRSESIGRARQRVLGRARPWPCSSRASR